MKNKRFIKYFIITFLFITPLISKAEDVQQVLENKHGIIITPFTGYRHDIFQWSIPLDSSNSRTLSELTWKNHIFETGIKIRTEPRENQLNFQGQFKYGYILKNSQNQDSDWDDIGEFARSFSNVKGNIIDLSGSVGFSQKFTNNLVTLYLGLDYTKYLTKDYGLNYTISRFYNQNITNNLRENIPKSELVAKYTFDHYAPWMGASIQYNLTDKITIVPTLKFYLFYLSGNANWILRDDLEHNPSFTDKSFGIGGSFETELFYKYRHNLFLNANIGIKKFDMKQGIRKTFLANGHSITSDLKKTVFSSTSVSVGLKYMF